MNDLLQKNIIQSNKDLRTILESLFDNNQSFNRLFSKLVQTGIFKPSTGFSLTKNYSATEIIEENGEVTYTIGFDLKNPGKTRNNILFMPKSFNEEEYRSYRLLHEFIHIAIDQEIRRGDELVTKLLSYFRQKTEIDGNYQTGLSSWYRYAQGQEIVFDDEDIAENVQLEEEDLVELMTMFFWDEAYFINYMNFINLDFESSEQERFDEAQKYNIRLLEGNEVSYLTEIIQIIGEKILE